MKRSGFKNRGKPMKRTRMKPGRKEPMTPEDEARRDAIKAGACMACLLNRYPLLMTGMKTEMHHVKDVNNRIGHQASYGNREWHHRAVCHDGMGKNEMAERHGPSLAEGSKPYKNVYGSEESLIERQNAILKGQT